MLKLVESFEDSEHYFLVTQFMPAGDLMNYLMKQKQQPLSENHVRKVIKQIAIGIQSLHRQLIIHRDLKIQNIFMSDLTENAVIRIGDLGSAKMLTSLTEKTSFRIGTPGFMAPEVMQDSPYSFSCDVWSLGCIMHTMLFATCPFWHDDRQERKRLVCDPSLKLDFDSNQCAGTLSSACRNFLI